MSDQANLLLRDGQIDELRIVDLYKTTDQVTVTWQSTKPTAGHIVRLLFCFGSWGMGYGEIARRTADDIFTPSMTYPATADETTALVSANFYEGIRPETLPPSVEDAPMVETATGTAALPPKDLGKLLARYAVLSDSHVGQRPLHPAQVWQSLRLRRIHDP